MRKIPTISKDVYEMLVQRQAEGNWAGMQSNVKCKLGESKTFKVKDGIEELTLRCSQHGGTFTGYYTYVLD